MNSTQKWYIFYTMFIFEFDDRKSRANLSKHGINFLDAQLLWNDPNLLEIPAKTEDEARYLVIGKIDGKLWSAVITYRGTNIRLISVRRSRNEEAILYEG
nr:BrnT family toxin [Leptospirillum sp. Group II 'CF-1']